MTDANGPGAVGSRLTADVVVIGSGPGGAVTATLCAEAGKSVLLVEEGEDLPLESAPHFSREEIIQKYRNAGINIGLGKAKLAYVEGRCVGGGSEINRGLYHRIPDYVLEGWRSRFDVADLSPEGLVAHFDACEATARVEYLPGEAPLISTRLHDGAISLGWNSIEVPRLYAYADQRNDGAPGRKQSMSATFVPRFRDAGGRLISSTLIKSVSRTNGKWTVRGSHTPAGQSARAIELCATTVFVACGAVQTPVLLRRSGIKRNVGNSLRFHPMLKVVAEFDEEVNLPGELEPVHQIKEFDPRFSMGCSMSKRPALAMAMAAHPERISEVDRNWRRMAIYYVQSTGGVGTVRCLPGFRDPLVRVSLTPADLDELADGLRRLAEVLFAAGAVKVYPSIPGYPILRSPADIGTLPATLSPAQANATALHLFSSCPMGENEALCAADSYGKVHGGDGLYIADSSLLCGPTVVNPQGTVMAIAHRNALKAISDGFR
ncbi:GMC family oxidoreductase [Sphingomonas sp. SUN019]|uniref:GMC family oxidoreductase N-terminal domain-containing protein n=1 Tax=Sphingomonas sp. SUN019 TaxID=2937788 RepID=UPI0021649530|nr:GMC family oxidoreductase [Sphingomonas sp. SUN019]UVO50359.1 GMC family oxidoreductase [Sphingomonas sp. SUN019]